MTAKRELRVGDVVRYEGKRGVILAVRPKKALKGGARREPYSAHLGVSHKNPERGGWIPRSEIRRSGMVGAFRRCNTHSEEGDPMTPNDPDVPRQMRVSCYNAKDGCKNHASYMGVKPVRKLCPTCLESGAPCERPQAGFNFEKATRRLRKKPLYERGDFSYDGEMLYAVTCWPKTFSGGRVMPCRTEG